MKRYGKPIRLALLAALMLMLALPTGCAGEESGADQPSDDAAVSAEQETASGTSEDSPEAETSETAEPEDAEPEETAPESAVSGSAASAEPAQEEPQQQEEPAQNAVAPAATPTPEETAPEETAPAASSLADGTYTIAVTLSGGSGKATVASPATLRVENGAFWATLTWSSSNYDYMKVGGETYLPLSLEGGSVFEIPVSALDCSLSVVADTVAMSTPHEIEYTLYFDSSTIQSAS